MSNKTNRRAFCTWPLLGLGIAKAKKPAPGSPKAKPATYARIPDDTPLDAVKWTGGFWHDRMRRLREIYLPGVMDGSFVDLANGASFRNLLRAAGLEQGGALGRGWSDGDCYYVLDTVSRLHAYRPDEYLKTKLDYWIPIIARCQREDGLVDTFTSLGSFDSKSAQWWGRFEQDQRKTRFQGTLSYNTGHLHAAATAHQRATGEDRLLAVADKALQHHIDEVDRRRGTADAGGYFEVDSIVWAYGERYARAGEKRFLNGMTRPYAWAGSVFGPPLRDAVEIFGHGVGTAVYLIGAAALYNYTGEKAVLDALTRLAGNLLSAKIFITGAVAPIQHRQRPEQVVNGKTYKGIDIGEAVGERFDLPNDSAYCESCACCLYMEWFYRMFRLTGEAAYMDAVERSLYNAVPGCVDLEKANFFYCNPQEQTSGSKRRRASEPDADQMGNYTWKRAFTKKCACCPPKVMRAIALSAEMAYSVNSEGVWVNLYGDNTATVALPGGGTLECRQQSEYPWDGTVRLVVDKVESKKPFAIFLRVPGWVDGQVRIALNGEVIADQKISGAYHRIERKWKSGDTVEMRLPMPVRLMAAHPNVADDRGKVAIMRGPVVYCLEGDGVPEGVAFENVHVPADAILKPVVTKDLGGVVKLTGSLVYSATAPVSAGKLVHDATESALYREARFAENGKKLGDGDRYVTVSMIPYYARLNGESDYFRIWLPVYPGHGIEQNGKSAIEGREV